MSRRQKDPLRPLTEAERTSLSRLSRSQSAPAVRQNCVLRERATGRPSLSATMLLNATAVVPVLTVQANILGAGVLETLVTAAARAMLVVWLLYALLPAPPEEAASGAPAGAALDSMPMAEHNGAARTLAKVAIVLPAQLFYLAEPTALAFPALLGLVTFLTAQDPEAGRAQLVILLLATSWEASPPPPRRWPWRSVRRCPQ